MTVHACTTAAHIATAAGAAVSGDVIQIAAGTYDLSGAALLTIADGVEVAGAGKATTLLNGAAINVSSGTFAATSVYLHDFTLDGQDSVAGLNIYDSASPVVENVIVKDVTGNGITFFITTNAGDVSTPTVRDCDVSGTTDDGVSGKPSAGTVDIGAGSIVTCIRVNCHDLGDATNDQGFTVHKGTTGAWEMKLYWCTTSATTGPGCESDGFAGANIYAYDCTFGSAGTTYSAAGNHFERCTSTVGFKFTPTATGLVSSALDCVADFSASDTSASGFINTVAHKQITVRRCKVIGKSTGTTITNAGAFQLAGDSAAGTVAIIESCLAVHMMTGTSGLFKFTNFETSEAINCGGAYQTAVGSVKGVQIASTSEAPRTARIVNNWIMNTATDALYIAGSQWGESDVIDDRNNVISTATKSTANRFYDIGDYAETDTVGAPGIEADYKPTVDGNLWRNGATATLTSLGTTDLAGNPRTVAGLVSRGPYEYVAPSGGPRFMCSGIGVSGFGSGLRRI